LVGAAAVSVVMVMGDDGSAVVERSSKELLQAEATSSAARRAGADNRMVGFDSLVRFGPFGTY
jgi:hypothetical protein